MQLCFLPGIIISKYLVSLTLKKYDVLVVLQAIETGLFSIYPFVFVVQVTWIISVMTTVMASPYVFVVLGYVGFFIITFLTFFFIF